MHIKTWCLSVVYLDANQFLQVQLMLYLYTVSREEWINKIPTPNLKVSGKTRVCIKHFDDKDIKRSDIFKCRNGDPDVIVSRPRL